VRITSRLSRREWQNRDWVGLGTVLVGLLFLAFLAWLLLNLPLGG
jgi:hypothetical protein